MFALQLIYISVLFRPRAYEYAAFSAVSRVAVAGCSGAVSEASAHKILISESLKVLRNFQKPTGAFVQMSEALSHSSSGSFGLFIQRAGQSRRLSCFPSRALQRARTTESRFPVLPTAGFAGSRRWKPVFPGPTGFALGEHVSLMFAGCNLLLRNLLTGSANASLGDK